ncbi:uncharacterized protein LOC112345550 [Selaginella moellendorffii]|uniref:uncharacterized protein LOC112345550 n=1 Tax=Selaginella moellendorffii TaxID=88036 RepID=UPI000D1CF5E9|nr:uncharacterized protein LOC112345550 [Selaginella moellendorffii]|eukprot:XP_024528325.1 uncharacterized protein LOC112345550 [Selaginella moellendorffii]
MASSAYESVKGGKLSLKLGANAADRPIAKKRKKKKAKAQEEEESGAGKTLEESGGYEIDTGIGHAPDGKKSKKYEELFPVETKRFGYEIPKSSAAAAAAVAASVKESASREAALDERVKKKADRYCK